MSPINEHTHQFIVLPNTGIQICRGFTIPALSQRKDWSTLVQLAAKRVARQGEDVAIGLVRDHIACDSSIADADRTDWIAAEPSEVVFFRLTRIDDDINCDIVVDTRTGAGAQIANKIPLGLLSGSLLWRKRYLLVDVFIEEHSKATNETGSLIMDFGNTGCSFIFSRTGQGPRQARLVKLLNPFDPDYKIRTLQQRSILLSSTLLLRVDKDRSKPPWMVMGERARELIDTAPLATHIYAPKKYVRDWPDHLKQHERKDKFRGIIGQRDGLHPMQDFVQYILDWLLQMVLASITNPEGLSQHPDVYPQVTRLMLTYPLTWRKVDRKLFKEMMETSAARVFVQEPSVREQFKVELTCSEPVAVAAYVCWESLFYFGSDNLPLMASFMGNLTGLPELRMLVIDMGGGSTDIACVDIGWSVREEDGSVDVTFQMIESMRFNRAGDRISHLIATAIFEYLRDKYDIRESLDFNRDSIEPGFTLRYKRRAVSKLSQLAERAKVEICGADHCWTLSEKDEAELLETFSPLGISGASEPPTVTISERTLLEWVEEDRQPDETGGEGFMDIFAYIEELCLSLARQERTPHLAILSGRTSRLPFMRKLVCEATRLQPHRVRAINQILPKGIKKEDENDIDKLAVVSGAQRFRFGDHVRFSTLEDKPIFNRYIGTVYEQQKGLQLKQVMVQPGDGAPRTISVAVDPNVDVRIGHAFREKGIAQIIAVLSSNASERREVELNVKDDYTVELKRGTNEVFSSEWVPGGSDLVVDNFNDTGRIDCEPEGFIAGIVHSNRQRWDQSTVKDALRGRRTRP